MADSIQRKRDADAVVGLIELAVRQEHLGGLREILKEIGISLDAAACVLWKAAPYIDARTGQNRERFQVVGDWMSDGTVLAAHDLPLDSLTARAIKAREPQVARRGDPQVSADPRLAFALDSRLKAMCSAPLEFPGSIRGALNIFRETYKPFEEEDVARASRFAKVVPILYESIREKAAVACVERVRELIEKVERASSAAPEAFEEFCKILSDHFACIESSLFLENTSRPGEFDFRAGTCAKYLTKRTYTRKDRGVTAWALQHAKPVKIADLAHFNEDLPDLQREYPGISWQDTLHIKETTREILGIERDTEFPPFSYMAVPVLVGDELLGVIRCCTAKRPPYYFSDDELTLLRVVGSQLGHFWKARLNRRELEGEISSWRNFGVGIRDLNTVAVSELEKRAPDWKRIWQRGLRVAAEAIPGSQMLDIRLYDESKNDLRFIAFDGDDWEQGDAKTIQDRKQTRFPVGESQSESAGSWVYRHDQHLIVSKARQEFSPNVFPDAQKMIVAPISTGAKRYGVLDVRSKTKEAFSPQAASMAELLGRQLGLYQYLAEVIADLRRAQSRLTATLQAQDRIYEDLEHQLRSPVRQAMQRLSDLLNQPVSEPRRQYALEATRGLIGKAYSVANSIAIFRALHTGRRLQIHRARLTEEDLVKALIETCADNRLLLGSELGVRAVVDSTAFSVLRENEVEADFELLEQAVHNVVENAFKYSHPQTGIKVSGGMEDGHFYISVSNRGIPISEDDRLNAVKRGWRSDYAKSITASGSGIGLWIVDHIMKAHGGRLELGSVTRDRTTVVRLLFPVKKER